MGAGLGLALRTGGARVVATVAGRSPRTARLATGLELLPSLADVVAAADIVLSVTPPGQASAAARAIAEAAGPHRPLLADLNATSPATVRTIATGPLPLVDGSISGPPPTVRPGARIFLSGDRAGEVAALPWAGAVEPIVLAGGIGTASAVKMCTASVYKGLNGLLTQALRTAGAYGVLEPVLRDLGRNGLDDTAGVATSATKAFRFVDEMREIAAAQAGAGLTRALFDAFAEVYADVAGTRLADGDPENVRSATPAEVVDGLARRSRPE